MQQNVFFHPDDPSNKNTGKTVKEMQLLSNPRSACTTRYDTLLAAAQQGEHCTAAMSAIALEQAGLTSSINDRADNQARHPLKYARQVFLVSSATLVMLQHAVPQSSQFMLTC